MDIKEFTKNVLIDLDVAVSEARIKTERDITFTGSKDNRTVEFDIAVSVENATEKSGEAGIKVLEFIGGDGKISKEIKNATVSRIKFGVNFDSYTKKEQDNISKQTRALYDEE